MDGAARAVRANQHFNAEGAEENAEDGKRSEEFAS